MVSGLNKYPAYKDSGIEWLGEIPEHWVVARLQNIGTFTASGINKKINPDEPLVSMVNYMDIYGNASREISPERPLMQVSCSADKILSCNVCKGDLVFTPSSETKEDIGLSSLITEDLDNTVFSYHTIRFRFTTEFQHRYKKYLCNNHYVLNQFSRSSKGTTRQILVRDDFKNIRVLVPSSKEQQAIADYLDIKTVLIDELIDKKKQQIEFLKEQRTAIINKAVTKGLNPNVKMKDSGIEWLGKIPNHWRLIKTKYLFTLTTEQAPPDNDYELLSIYTDIGVRPRKELEQRGNRASTTDGYWIVKKGDIIVNKLLAWMGAIGCSDYDGVTSPAYDILRKATDLNMNSIFYHYLFRCGLYLPEFKRRSRGIMEMRLRLYFDEFGQIPLVYPPFLEQNQIVEYLDNFRTETDATIDKAQKQIELLQECRTALISEAVTGKIDVRREF